MVRIVRPTADDSSLSAFGDQRVVTLTPVTQLLAAYNNIGSELETFSATGGSVSASGGEYICQTGTSIGGYGVIRSSRPTVYKPGTGITSRFTARFTTGVALSLQQAGPFNIGDGFVFGFNGADFGVCHISGGKAEIRELQVTAAASGTESLTITINGSAHTFNVSSTNIADNAQTIAEQLDANISGWDFFAVGGTITCYYQSTAAATNTFSFVNNTGGGTCAASFSTVVTGVAKTEDWVVQADWNTNTVPWLDPTKSNVYQVDIQYLGSGAVTFLVEDPTTGRLTTVHKFRFPNSQQGPTVNIPSYKVGWVAASLGSSGTNLTCAGSSAATFIDGQNRSFRPAQAKVVTKSGISTTATNILSVQVRKSFNDKGVVGEIRPAKLIASTDSTKGAIFELYVNPTITGDIRNFTFQDEDTSIAIVDTSNGTYSSGGRLIAILVVGVSGDKVLTFDPNQFILPGETLTIFGRVTSGAASEITAALLWEEDF